MVGKSLQLLREIAPNIKRAAIMFNPHTNPGGGRYYLSAFEVAAQSLVVAAIAAPVHNDVEIEAAITSLGSEPGSAAQYVDRLLRDTNPAERPVQVPVKFETSLNLKTAKALGLEVPTTLLAIADEVIE
jgi:putative tryptophan/tyrosine transport system substrate-binding protein